MWMMIGELMTPENFMRSSSEFSMIGEANEDWSIDIPPPSPLHSSTQLSTDKTLMKMTNVMEKGPEKKAPGLTGTEWDRLRVYGVPLWIKEQAELKKLAEGLSRQLVMRVKNTSDMEARRGVADICSLLFCMMGKVKPLQILKS